MALMIRDPGPTLLQFIACLLLAIVAIVRPLVRRCAVRRAPKVAA